MRIESPADTCGVSMSGVQGCPFARTRGVVSTTMPVDFALSGCFTSVTCQSTPASSVAWQFVASPFLLCCASSTMIPFCRAMNAVTVTGMPSYGAMTARSESGHDVRWGLWFLGYGRLKIASKVTEWYDVRSEERRVG